MPLVVVVLTRRQLREVVEEGFPRLARLLLAPTRRRLPAPLLRQGMQEEQPGCRGVLVEPGLLVRQGEEAGGLRAQEVQVQAYSRAACST